MHEWYYCYEHTRAVPCQTHTRDSFHPRFHLIKLPLNRGNLNHASLNWVRGCNFKIIPRACQLVRIVQSFVSSHRHTHTHENGVPIRTLPISKHFTARASMNPRLGARERKNCGAWSNIFSNLITPRISAHGPFAGSGKLAQKPNKDNPLFRVVLCVCVRTWNIRLP